MEARNNAIIPIVSNKRRERKRKMKNEEKN
jgi:hypothetical protein